VKGDGKAEGGGRARFPTVLTSITQEKATVGCSNVVGGNSVSFKSVVWRRDTVSFVRGRVKCQGQVGYSLWRGAPHAERGRPG